MTSHTNGTSPDDDVEAQLESLLDRVVPQLEARVERLTVELKQAQTRLKRYRALQAASGEAAEGKSAPLRQYKPKTVSDAMCERVWTILANADGPMTAAEVAQVAGVHHTSAYNALVAMREQERVRLAGKAGRVLGERGPGANAAVWATYPGAER